MATASSSDPVATAVLIAVMGLILMIIAGASRSVGKALATLVVIFLVIGLVAGQLGTDVKQLKAKL